MRKTIYGMCALLLLQLAPARGQDNGGATTQPGEQEQINQLKSDNSEMEQEIADLKKQEADQATNASQDEDDFDKSMKAVHDELAKISPGLESLVIVGDANFGFQAVHGTDSTYFADLSPLILWQPVDSHFLIESAFDLGIGGADINSETTTVSLELADISYDLCDYCTIGAGLFTVPFGQYHNHFDPPWIDKFPDDPLAFDAIAPISEVGFFIKGAIPSGTTKWTYDLYTANGPNLDTVNAGTAGQLNFDDFTDLNNNKAVGGRIGFLPFPDMEMGYSLQYSEPEPDGFQHVYALLQAADFHWKPTIHAISGQLDLSAEWIWSNVSPATYDPTGGMGFGPVTFNNYRQGGYVSAGYRPTEINNKILRNFEFLFRYDSLQSPLNSPGGEHEQRWTAGLDYWFTSYIVLKAAYEFDHREVTPDQDAFILQVGVGL